ncbi:MAG: transposase [Lachnospiraceae bacterium]|nr:transposase [Lachnospiraceae bacterium]
MSVHLSKKTVIQVCHEEANIIGHLCYAACKLWNICNYERIHYKELPLEQYPDWYYQKSHHKDDLWFKSLPSQTAQEVCKQLDKAWKSFYRLCKTGGIENPRPPRFKQEPMVVTYMQNAIVHVEGSKMVRLALPKRLKEYMSSAYGVCADYLYLENQIFQNTDIIKQIKIYPPDAKNECGIIVVYEVPDVETKPENGNTLSIDLGLHNLLTCYDSCGSSFILGRRYLSICHGYDKKIATMQGQWAKCQTAKGVRYPKPSRHLLRMYQKKKNAVRDYLHKVTKYLAEYCKEHEIARVVIGDITNIRKNNNQGKIINQKLHSLPYRRICHLLEYKLKQYGILLVKQNEAYSSQCSPTAPEVSKEYAVKANRKQRGLYLDRRQLYNADAVGAFNIMRKYYAVSGIEKKLPVSGLDEVKIIKVAV